MQRGTIFLDLKFISIIKSGRNGKMKKALVVVDMQKDFISGALGTKEAEAVVDNVAEVIRTFDGEVIFTRDTHTDKYLETQEGRNLPVSHCIKDSDGWQLDKKLASLRTEPVKIFDKPTFGSVALAEYLKENEELESVTLIGLCTDICVISNALLIKAFLPEAEIRVMENCCAGVTPKSHENALEAMKMCQIKIV
jgi:nicotinamidase-related amidase